jgi:hypothetical protein
MSHPHTGSRGHEHGHGRGRGGARLELGRPGRRLLITAAILAVLGQEARAICQRLMDAVDPVLTDQAERTLRTCDGVLHAIPRLAGALVHADPDSAGADQHDLLTDHRQAPAAGPR